MKEKKDIYGNTIKDGDLVVEYDGSGLANLAVVYNSKTFPGEMEVRHLAYPKDDTSGLFLLEEQNTMVIGHIPYELTEGTKSPTGYLCELIHKAITREMT